MSTVPTPTTDLASALKRASRDLIKQDRVIVRAQIFHRSLILSTIAGAVAFSIGMMAMMFGAGNGAMTHIHKDDAHGHGWPAASLPS